MKILWDAKDFNIDHGYILNYVQNEYGYRSLHTIQVSNGAMRFLTTLESQDSKVIKVNGSAVYNILHYANDYEQRIDDIHFLLSDEEVYKHVLMEEI